MSDLKPCPFCGQTPTQTDGVVGHSIDSQPSCPLEYQAFSVEAWNRRSFGGNPDGPSDMVFALFRNDPEHDVNPSRIAEVLEAHTPHVREEAPSGRGTQWKPPHLVTVCRCGMEFGAIDARAWHRHAAAMVENAVREAIVKLGAGGAPPPPTEG